MKVEQMMSRSVHSCRDNEPLLRAVELMWKHDIGCVPVLDTNGGLAGVITDRDCVMAAYHQGKRLDEVMIRSAMTRKVATVQPTDTLEAAATTMKKAQVRRLPVVNKKGALVGMIALTDLSRAAESEPNQKVREQYITTVETALSAVGTPRVNARA